MNFRRWSLAVRIGLVAGLVALVFLPGVVIQYGERVKLRGSGRGANVVCGLEPPFFLDSQDPRRSLVKKLEMNVRVDVASSMDIGTAITVRFEYKLPPEYAAEHPDPNSDFDREVREHLREWALSLADEAGHGRGYGLKHPEQYPELFVFPAVRSGSTHAVLRQGVLTLYALWLEIGLGFIAVVCLAPTVARTLARWLLRRRPEWVCPGCG